MSDHEQAPSVASNDSGVIVDDSKKPCSTTPESSHYHSVVRDLITWKDTRQSSIAFGVSALLIVAAHYLPIVRISFKTLYLSFGLTALVEVLSNNTVGTGLISKFRPAKYYTINKNSLQQFLNDVAEVANFLVIEFQRVLFVEDANVTGAAFVATFISYWFVKYLPLWALALAADCLAFLGPVVYNKNKEVIDSYVDMSAAEAQKHAAQLKVTATRHARSASASFRTLVSPYIAKLPAAFCGGEKPVEAKN